MHGDPLDQKVTRTFAGKVVRKDLLHQIKGGENVPSYVLEYLLGKYCASDDEDKIRIGIDAAKETLRDNYFRHDESNKAQSMVELKAPVHRPGRGPLPGERDQVLGGDGQLQLHEHPHPDDYSPRYEPLLEGGIWAILDFEFRPHEEGTKGSPFHVADLKPIQLAELSRAEWVDLLMRSVRPGALHDGATASTRRRGTSGSARMSRVATRCRPEDFKAD